MNIINTIAGVFKGKRPDITPAQLPAIVVALAALLSSFGVYDLTTEQQESLIIVGGLALSLVIGDAKLRGDRNKADALVKASGNTPVMSDDLPTDEEEFGDLPAPDVEVEEGNPPLTGDYTPENPVQISQDKE